MGTTSRAAQASRPSALAGQLRVSVGKLIRRVREQAHPGDFTSAQKSALLLLEKLGPVTVSTLARAENVRPQSMRITVASLEKMGLIGGAPHPTDGRKTFISLTAAGRATLRRSRAAKEDWLQRALQAQLSRHERKQLAIAVDLLCRLADFQR